MLNQNLKRKEHKMKLNKKEVYLIGDIIGGIGGRLLMAFICEHETILIIFLGCWNIGSSDVLIT